MGWDRGNYPDADAQETKGNDGEPIDSAWRNEFNDAWWASEHQRDQCAEDINFVMHAGGQWDGWIGDSYDDDRPRMEMDKVYEKVNMFMSQFSEAKPGVNFSPASGSPTSMGEAELMNDMFRADMRRDNGNYSIWNAVHEAALGGSGAFRFRAKYEDPEDDENIKQVICAEPIHSAHSVVVWDPNAKRYDKRDARYCYVMTFMTWNAYEERFPGRSRTTMNYSTRANQFSWWAPGGLYIAERYWVEESPRESVTLYNDITGETIAVFADEFAGSIDEYKARGYEEIRRKMKMVRRVYKATINGSEVIEEKSPIAGKHIPIVPVFAFWMFINTQEAFMGLVRKQKDPQRLFNMQASSLAELAATSVKEVPIFAPEQMVGPGIKGAWAEAHLGKTNYLLANPLRDESGAIISNGPLGYTKSPDVSPAMAAVLQLTSDYIAETSSFAPTQLPNREISGPAVDKITKRVDLKTYVVMENVFNSLILAGDIYKDMAEEIYSERREVKLLSADGTERIETINDSAPNPRTGLAEPINMISGRRFECFADVGPSWSSQIEEAKTVYGNLLQNMQPDNPYYPVIMAEYFALLQGTSPAFKKFNRQKQLELGIRQPETPEEQQYVENLQKQAAQPSPNDQLLAAAAEKESAQADESRAKTQKTQADTQKVLSDIRVNESTIERNKAAAVNDVADAASNDPGGFVRAARVIQFPRSSQGA